MVSDPLVDILRSYATLKSPKLLQKPTVAFQSAHNFLIDHVLLNPHFQEFPPSSQYQLSFWKWAIDWLEDMMTEEDELDERIYTHQIELMQSTSSKIVGSTRPQVSYLTYLWPTARMIERPVYPGYASATLLESRTTIEAGTTGLRTWSASLVLAEYLITNPELITGRRVLELGCGVGFLGVIAASVQLTGHNWGDASLWLTDVHEPVLQRCEVNLTLPCNDSHHHPNLKTHLLDWTDALDPSTSVSALFNEALPAIILGADLVYEPAIIPLLVGVLNFALTPRGGQHDPVAYIALTVRNKDTVAKFILQAGSSLIVEEVAARPVAGNIFTQSTELGQDVSQEVKILRIRRQAS